MMMIYEQYFKKLEKKLKSIRIEGLIIQQEDNRVFEYLKNKKVQDKLGKVYSITREANAAKGVFRGIFARFGEFSRFA
jgi:hypothetical protein